MIALFSYLGLLAGLYLLMMGLTLWCLTLVTWWEWRCARQEIEELQERARLRHVLHRKGPGRPCRPHARRCTRHRHLS